MIARVWRRVKRRPRPQRGARRSLPRPRPRTPSPPRQARRRQAGAMREDQAPLAARRSSARARAWAARCVANADRVSQRRSRPRPASHPVQIARLKGRQGMALLGNGEDLGARTRSRADPQTTHRPMQPCVGKEGSPPSAAADAAYYRPGIRRSGPHRLRFGIPGDEDAWRRLAAALWGVTLPSRRKAAVGLWVVWGSARLAFPRAPHKRPGSPVRAPTLRPIPSRAPFLPTLSRAILDGVLVDGFRARADRRRWLTRRSTFRRSAPPELWRERCLRRAASGA